MHHVRRACHHVFTSHDASLDCHPHYCVGTQNFSSDKSVLAADTHAHTHSYAHTHRHTCVHNLFCTGVKPVMIELTDMKTKKVVDTLEVDACMVATGR